MDSLKALLALMMISLAFGCASAGFNIATPIDDYTYAYNDSNIMLLANSTANDTCNVYLNDIKIINNRTFTDESTLQAYLHPLLDTNTIDISCDSNYTTSITFYQERDKTFDLLYMVIAIVGTFAVIFAIFLTRN